MYGGRNDYPDRVNTHTRHRFAASLRLLAYAILALSLLLRPVLSSLGEIHELAHDPTGSHFDVAAGADKHHGQAADAHGTGDGGDAKVLHSLLHFAHCCGQLSAAMFEATSGALAPVAAGSLRATNDPSLPLAPWQTPFRPPITT